MSTFKRMDKVAKPNGYAFDGTVLASYKTLAGETRVVVESDAIPGLQHIFSPEQLRLRVEQADLKEILGRALAASDQDTFDAMRDIYVIVKRQPWLNFARWKDIQFICRSNLLGWSITDRIEKAEAFDSYREANQAIGDLPFRFHADLGLMAMSLFDLYEAEQQVEEKERKANPSADSGPKHGNLHVIAIFMHDRNGVTFFKEKIGDTSITSSNIDQAMTFDAGNEADVTRMNDIQREFSKKKFCKSSMIMKLDHMHRIRNLAVEVNKEMVELFDESNEAYCERMAEISEIAREVGKELDREAEEDENDEEAFVIMRGNPVNPLFLCRNPVDMSIGWTFDPMLAEGYLTLEEAKRMVDSHELREIHDISAVRLEDVLKKQAPEPKPDEPMPAPDKVTYDDLPPETHGGEPICRKGWALMKKNFDVRMYYCGKDEYGLACYVWSRDINQAIAFKLKADAVKFANVACYNDAYPVNIQAMATMTRREAEEKANAPYTIKTVKGMKHVKFTKSGVESPEFLIVSGSAINPQFFTNKKRGTWSSDLGEAIGFNDQAKAKKVVEDMRKHGFPARLAASSQIKMSEGNV